MNKMREKWKTFSKSAVSTEWWRKTPDREKRRNGEHDMGQRPFFPEGWLQRQKGAARPSKGLDCCCFSLGKK